MDRALGRRGGEGGAATRTGAVMVAAGDRHCAVVMGSGDLMVWGDGDAIGYPGVNVCFFVCVQLVRAHLCLNISYKLNLLTRNELVVSYPICKTHQITSNINERT